jgi:hypothetical protein
MYVLLYGKGSFAVLEWKEESIGVFNYPEILLIITMKYNGKFSLT